ncbi:MAG: PilZ domain-containing protein [Leptospira sp.]|nr:PilZ domain-containing protein [Leptospira sp.]
MNKEISDQDGILKVISALFGKLPVTIVADGKEIPVKVIALKNKALIINTIAKFPSKARILTLVHNGNKFVAQLTLIGGDGNGIEILQPLKITILPATRQGNRVEVNQSSNANMTITNLINVIDVTKAIGFDDKKVDAILLAYRSKLSKIYPNSSIYLASRPDNRLRLMQHYDKSIYIVDRKSKATANPVYLPFDEYLRIFDTSKLSDELISEIAIPLRYKGYVSLGYVQILSNTPLDNEAFSQVQLFSQAVARDIIATGVFQESKEICPVVDLSSGGISFLHAPTRAFSRNVTMNGTIIFDLIMNQNSRATFRGIIKNIRNQETNYRVGCQFYNTNVRDSEILEEFLGITHPTEETAVPESSETSNIEENTQMENGDYQFNEESVNSESLEESNLDNLELPMPEDSFNDIPLSTEENEKQD